MQLLTFLCAQKQKSVPEMFDETDKHLSDEEKLNKFIEQKISENEALQKLLEALNNENNSSKTKPIKNK